MNRISYFIIFLSLMLTTGTKAEINGAPSLEWLSVGSDMIFQGKYLRTVETKDRLGTPYPTAIFEVNDLLKGKDSPPSVEICLWPTAADYDKKWLMHPDNWLIFLKRIDPNDMSCNFVPCTWELYDRWYGAIALYNPSDVYGKEQTIVTNSSDILKIVREWANSTIKYSINLELGLLSPIGKKLYSGSSCYLTVPAEDKYKEKYIAMSSSRSIRERTKAAKELYKFKGKDAEEAIKQLLLDESQEYLLNGPDSISSVAYPVRAAAYESLKKLGIEVHPIIAEREPNDSERNEQRIEYWSKNIREWLPDGWYLDEVINGEKRHTPYCDGVAVIVNIRHGTVKYSVILVPKEWEYSDAKYPRTLGYNNGQCGRRYYVSKDFPRDVAEMLAKYQGLVESAKGGV